MTHAFSVHSLGRCAARAMVDGAHGTVVAVFAQSFHVLLDGKIVCVGDQRLGRGPLNALITDDAAENWSERRLVVGQPCRISGSRLEIEGGPQVDFTDAVTWSAQAWPSTWAADTIFASLAALATAAIGKIPADGLACLAFGEGGAMGLGGALQETAGLRAAALSEWLATELEGSDERHNPTLVRDAQSAVTGLMGLGPGLTPAGDDLLAGVLIALHASGEGATAAALGNFVRAAPSDQTGALSRSFLEAAIEGLPGEAMAVMISALLRGDQASLPAALGAIDAIGHTSGWDMLAGAVLGLAAVASARAAAGLT